MFGIFIWEYFLIYVFILSIFQKKDILKIGNLRFTDPFIAALAFFRFFRHRIQLIFRRSAADSIRIVIVRRRLSDSIYIFGDLFFYLNRKKEITKREKKENYSTSI